MSSPRKTLLFLFAAAAAATAAISTRPSTTTDESPLSPSGKKLIVHEWGTFTSLQDETGTNLTGINSDDEPVPFFVHRLSAGLTLGPEAPMLLGKGIPSRVPNVTMRLETPVLYFYPPADRPVMHVDVRVQFRGGWLTEFFPYAAFKAPGFTPNKPSAGRISPNESGELFWHNLVIGAPGPLVPTTAPVWLAPRAVNAATISNGAPNQSEKYVFYRGVGNVKPPVRVVRDQSHQTLQIIDERKDAFRDGWLVSIHSDGTLAFENAAAHQPLPAEFPAASYSRENMAKLRESMQTALVQNGLYQDEAEAMLNTWQAAYFKSAGLRFFYLCPRSETDALLPLELSKPAEITRVMIGRIELVTPEQRTLLSQLRQRIERVPSVAPASITCNDAETKPAAAPPVSILPAEYHQLGRFRNALLLDEQARQPSEALKKLNTTLGI